MSLSFPFVSLNESMTMTTRFVVAFVLSVFLFAYRSIAARLVDFQVAQPLTLPADAKQCTIKVLE